MRAFVCPELVGRETEMAAIDAALCRAAGGAGGLVADLAPTDPRVMHGSSFRGDGGGALLQLADEFDQRVRYTLESSRPAVVAVGGSGAGEAR